MENKVLQQILAKLDNLEKGLLAQGQQLDTLEKGQVAQGQELDNLNKGLLAQGQQIEKLHSDLTKLAIHMEGEMTEKIRGMYDARSQIQDSLKRIEDRQDRQDERLDLHWREIQILRIKRR